MLGFTTLCTVQGGGSPVASSRHATAASSRRHGGTSPSPLVMALQLLVPTGFITRGFWGVAPLGGFPLFSSSSPRAVGDYPCAHCSRLPPPPPRPHATIVCRYIPSLLPYPPSSLPLPLNFMALANSLWLPPALGGGVPPTPLVLPVTTTLEADGLPCFFPTVSDKVPSPFRGGTG